MDYGKLCSELLESNERIRYVGVYNSFSGDVYEKMQDGTERHFDKDQTKGIEAILMDLCLLQGRYFQLAEAYETNTKVSREAADVTHKAVQKYQEFDSTLKAQGKSFSKRLESLEHHGF